MGKRRKHQMGKGKSISSGGTNRSAVAGLIGQVIGGAFILFALILFAIGIDQLDTAYTAAGSYTEQVGLQDIMGVWGMILFLVFVGCGITVIAGSSVYNFVKTISGGWMQAFLSFAMGVVGLVIALILNTLVQGQLHTAYVAANATANKASFSGMLDIMTVFGMLIFLVLIGSGVSGIVAAGWGAVRNVRAGI